MIGIPEVFISVFIIVVFLYQMNDFLTGLENYFDEGSNFLDEVGCSNISLWNQIPKETDLPPFLHRAFFGRIFSVKSVTTKTKQL